jgi:outer membrane lipoprotein
MWCRSSRCAWTLSLLVLAGGCATHSLPPEIREPPTPDLSVAQVQTAPAKHVGLSVRWGGVILAVRNLPELTEIEVLSRPLGDSGIPSAERAGQGRFVAQIAGFLDPAEYPKDRRITVAGDVLRTEARKVGDYPYGYPVVAVRSHRLWADPAPEPHWHRYPYYDPPFYPWGYPWYPWHPWYPRWPYYW